MNMRRLLRWSLLAFALSGLWLAVAWAGDRDGDRDRDHDRKPPTIETQGVPTIGGYRLIEEHRVSPTQSDFTYRAWLDNPLPVRLREVRATLTSRSPDVQVIRGRLEFEEVPPGATVDSENSFTIRHDRSLNLDFADLVWAIGVPLPGKPQSLAKDALFDLPSAGVDETQIQNGVILTRLDLRFAGDATVAQINRALLRVGGSIVSMSADDLALTIALPKQASPVALQRVANLLTVQPGIRFAKPAQEAQPFLLAVPLDPLDIAQIRYLLPPRFPAAYNAGVGLGLLDQNQNCTRAPVPVLVADFFAGQPPSGAIGDEVASFHPPAAPVRALSDLETVHGYLVATMIGGPHFGANPFTPCLDVHLVQIAGYGINEDIDQIARHMPPGRFIVNNSYGFPGCASPATDPCIPPHGFLTAPLSRAYDALAWKKQTQSRWGDFLIFNAAGNEHDGTGAQIYHGEGDARFESAPAIAAKASPLFSFVIDPSLWNPVPPFDAQGYDSLVPLAGPLSALASSIRDAGLTGANAIEPNVVVVGSATNRLGDTVLTTDVTPEQLLPSSFSGTGADISAIGENILDQELFRGTSLSSPQVAGLASYLWLLSDDLRNNQPVTATRQAILANARNNIVDAYASVLSLDAAALPDPVNAPVRLALLDANGDGVFDEKDIDLFLRHFFFVDANGTITHEAPASTAADFSRFDLNGDGFTTSGSRRERFDLDRVGSTQYGAAKYSIVTQMIEGQPVTFDETGLTDLEILCYYAYSDMFSSKGDQAARKALLADRCSFTISPTAITLQSGQTQILTASSDASFSIVSGSGTVQQKSATTALFTAGSTPGPVTVRATNAKNTSQTADAKITVTAGGTRISGTLTLTEHDPTDGTDLFDLSGSATVTIAIAADGTLSIVDVSGSVTAQNIVRITCTDPATNISGVVEFSTFSGSAAFDLEGAHFLSGGLIIHPKITDTSFEIELDGTGRATSMGLPPDSCTPVASDAPPPNLVFFQGTPIIVGGRFVGIDFNRNFSADTGTSIQSGKLTLQ